MMKKRIIVLIFSVLVFLVSPTLKMGLNTIASLFVLILILKFLFRFIKAFWKPLLFIVAVFYLKTNLGL